MRAGQYHNERGSMANVKAKTQKKTVKAKPSAKKPQGPAKAKAPAKKASKPASTFKASASKGKKAAPKPAPKKAAIKPVPKKSAKPVASKSNVTVKKTAPAPAKAQPKAPAKPVPVAQKTPAPKSAPAAKTPAPVTAKPAAAGKPAPEKPAPTTKSEPAKAPEKAVAAPVKKESEPKAASAKEAKTKAPVIAVMTGLDPLGAPARSLKRAQKERFFIEFYMNATPGSLYDMISSPSGLSEWFCDDADVRGEHFTFRWGNDERTAQCLSRKFGELMRFQWEDDEDQGAYFELRIRTDPMTNETCLVVTDHEWPKDLEEAKALWGSQIHALQRVLGA